MVVSLPNEIIFSEILIKLSAINLLKFKCVSKLWCKSLSDPCFVKAHLTLQRTLWPGRIKLYGCKPCAFYYDDIHNNKEESFYLNIRDIIKRKSSYELMASCDGLLVIETTVHGRGKNIGNERKQYYLLNPATKTCMLLPIPSRRYSNCRLVYDANSNSYKVVGWVFGGSFSVLSVGSYNTEPYWSTEPCWRILHLPEGERAPYYGIIAVNGHLLWLKGSRSDSVIRTLSLTDGEVGTIMLPEYNIKWELTIFESNGCLYLVNLHNKKQHCFVVWILEDWEKKKWTKIHQKYFNWRKKHECEENSCICLGSDFSMIDSVRDKNLIEVHDQITKRGLYAPSYKYETYFRHFNSLVDLKQTRKKRKRQQK